MGSEDAFAEVPASAPKARLLEVTAARLLLIDEEDRA